MSKVEEYIKTAKMYPFSIGDSLLLSEIEDHIYYMERYLDGKITAKKLVYILSDSCPDDNFIDYEGICNEQGEEGFRVGRCEECWMKALELEKEEE